MKSKSTVYNIIGCVAAVVAAMLVCVVSWRMWEIDFSVLPGVDSDNLLCAFMMKSVQQYGLRGVIANYMVGAPGYSALVDIPIMDAIQLIQVYLINLFTGDFVKTIYVFYLITFGTAAAGMYLLLTRFQVKWWINSAVSVIFAIAPYHFYREIIHASLSNYAAVPIGIYLAYVILEDRFSLIRRNDKGKISVVWKDLAVLLAAVFVGIGQVYYSFFIAVVMAVALIVRMIRDRSWKPLIRQGIILYGVCLAVVAGIMPKLLFGLMYGENTVAGIRTPMESELYGMKLIQLLMPSSFTRIPGLARLNAAYSASGVTINENAWSPLGIVASAAFLGLCGWLVFSFVSKGKESRFTGRMDFAALSTLALVLFCTVGGFGAIFNYLVTPQIRCYNRASIVIACLVLTAGALAVNRIEKKAFSVLLCVGCLILAVYDQVPVRESGWQNEMASAQEEYQRFFDRIEAGLEENAMVYQLPYTDFPEVPPTYNMTDYTSFLGYLLTDTVRWSYGGVKGRNPEAKMLYFDEGQSELFVEGIREAGFSGVLIDTCGYEDGGKEIVEFYQSYEFETITSGDGRYVFFELDD